MSLFVINTEEDKQMAIEAIRKSEGRFKLYVEPIFPKATPKQRAYLFGVVYEEIREFMGEQTVYIVHDLCMQLFNVEYSPLPNGSWEFRRKAGNEWDVISIAKYIERICSFFLLEFDLRISEPQEIFT